jgi:molybdate transport system permease protein
MTRARSPLPWLGALLALYLILPVAAFVVQLTHGVSIPAGVGDALVMSVVTATVSTAIIAFFGIPLAYALARAHGRVASALTVAVALPLALPPLMSGILLLEVIGPYTPIGHFFGGGLTDTPIGIVIAQTFVAAPFLVIAGRGAFAGVEPELEDVARTLGHGAVARFMKVALPLAWPGVQAGLTLAWLRAFGEFGATVIVAYHPYSLPVFTFVQFGSTGLPTTALPVASALGAAVVVLAGVQAHGRRRRPRARLPNVAVPQRTSAAPLQFSVQKRLGGFALRLEHAPRSSRLALVGASGSGKTLTLRLLAGIIEPDHADVSAGGRPLHVIRAEDRGFGYVPQRSALLPHRTVWQQLTFAVDAEPAVAAWWLHRLKLHGLENRFPSELSGGQERRVALARALARTPRLLLLDEPFSAVDAPLRRRLSRELRVLQREMGLATVLVTHDPDEAALLSDELVVLSGGRALQQGPTAQVFAHPASAAVASLLGVANTNTGVVRAAGCIASHGVELSAPTADLAPGTAVDWAVRAEDVTIRAGGRYEADVADAVTAGAVSEVTVKIGALELVARGIRRPVPPVGAACRFDVPPDAMMIWAREWHDDTADGALPSSDSAPLRMRVRTPSPVDGSR